MVVPAHLLRSLSYYAMSWDYADHERPPVANWVVHLLRGSLVRYGTDRRVLHKCGVVIACVAGHGDVGSGMVPYRLSVRQW